MATFEGKTSSRLSRDGKAAKIVESSGKFRVEVEGKQKGGLFSNKSSASSWAKASGYEVMGSRVDALVKDCDKLAARMDALNKRADACFTPKRADAGVKRVSKKARDQKIRDGVWEAVTDEKYGYQEIRDTRSGARFTIEVY